MLLLGFQTRSAAAVLSFNMLIAVKYHFFDPFSTKVLPVLFLGLYIIQFLLGAGRYSLDYLLYSGRGERFGKREVNGLLFFLAAFGIGWSVLGNWFTGTVSVCLAAAAAASYFVGWRLITSPPSSAD